MTKTRIEKARVRVILHWTVTGSVLKQTVQARCLEAETHLDVESDEPPERIAAVIRCAKQGCFAEQMLVHPVPVTGSIVVNGASFELAEYPPPDGQ